ncbi:D-alanyl-D-alanine carboxypeptidase [Bacillus sp. FJAT-51639]|uniref:D-alanyl-D-alanine carboxypeptidase n=1 Tax=Bacillus bruguierae TaxID=3127667 RepID=A0ABU8FQM8_9BACI
MKFHPLFSFIVGVLVCSLVFNFFTGKSDSDVFFLLILGAISGYQIGKNEIKKQISNIN